MILFILEIIIAVLLIGVILMQTQGSGLGSSFGGGGENFRSKQSLDKTLMYVTVVLVVLFAFVSILLVIPR